MRTFTKDCLREIQNKVDLPDLIYSVTKKPLKEFIHYEMECPFCDDKDSSLVVLDQKYFCKRCEASGDAVAFLMTYKLYSFETAITFLGPFTDTKLEFVNAAIHRSTSNKTNQTKTEIFEKVEKLLKELAN